MSKNPVPATGTTLAVIDAWSGNTKSAPAGLSRRPPGSTSTDGSLGSAPAYFTASPLGADAEHLPWVGVGYVPSQVGQALSWGTLAQGSRFWQS